MTHWCAVGAALLGDMVMLLMQIGSWAWNGMDLASSTYLIVTCGGSAATVASLTVAGSYRQPLAVFAITGSLALAALGSLFLVKQLFQSGIAGSEPLVVAGVPLDQIAMYGLTVPGSVTVAALAARNSRRSPEQSI